MSGNLAWFWVAVGPLSRVYVSPAFLLEVGPCLAYLLGHFGRLSPAPERYDDLVEHDRHGRSMTPVPFPAQGIALLQELLRGCNSRAPAAQFRLHVL